MNGVLSRGKVRRPCTGVGTTRLTAWYVGRSGVPRSIKLMVPTIHKNGSDSTELHSSGESSTGHPQSLQSFQGEKVLAAHFLFWITPITSSQEWLSGPCQTEELTISIALSCQIAHLHVLSSLAGHLRRILLHHVLAQFTGGEQHIQVAYRLWQASREASENSSYNQIPMFK